MLHQPATNHFQIDAPEHGFVVGSTGEAGASILPTWAQTTEARALLAAIKLNPPHFTVYDDGLSAWNGREYSAGVA